MSVRKTRKGEQHRGSAEECALESVTQSVLIRLRELIWRALGAALTEGLLEKGMATHFSIFAWRIPWTEEPGGLQSVGLQRVGLD